MGDTSPEKPVCLITGVGDTTGAALARRFAGGGYRVAMIARNADRLEALADDIPGTRPFVCDLADFDQVDDVLSEIAARMGDVTVLIHNAVAHSFSTFMDGDTQTLERNFRVNTTALLHLSKALTPAMISAGTGVIIATGNTASHRGVPNYAIFAPTKAAQRILCESLARDLGPRGIHVGYVTIDAAIDVTWLGPDHERPAWLVPPADWPHARADFFAKPHAIADEVWHLAHQDRSTWAFDVTVRPFAEPW